MEINGMNIIVQADTLDNYEIIYSHFSLVCFVVLLYDER